MWCKNGFGSNGSCCSLAVWGSLFPCYPGACKFNFSLPPLAGNYFLYHHCDISRPCRPLASGVCRWNDGVKREIKDSRVSVTKRIAAAINALPKAERPQVLVSSSAVGFYGTSETGTFNEESECGRDYLAGVCRAWEEAAQGAETRVVIVRTGIVLSTSGGALAKMIPIFNMFGGAPVPAFGLHHPSLPLCR